MTQFSVLKNGIRLASFFYENHAYTYLDLLCEQAEQGDTLELLDDKTGLTIIAFDENGNQVIGD